MDDLFLYGTSVQLVTEGGVKDVALTDFYKTYDFEGFWKAYNRVGNKKQAEKAYNKAIKRASHEEIIRGVAAYQAQCISRGTKREHIKHGSTFLNNDCWADEYHTEQPKQDKLGRTQNAAVRGHMRAENPDF